MGTAVLYALPDKSGLLSSMPAAAPTNNIGTGSHASLAMEAGPGTISLIVAAAPKDSTGMETPASTALPKPIGMDLAASPAKMDKYGTKPKLLANALRENNGMEQPVSLPALLPWSASMEHACVQQAPTSAIIYVSMSPHVPRVKAGTDLLALLSSVLQALLGMELPAPILLCSSARLALTMTDALV